MTIRVCIRRSSDHECLVSTADHILDSKVLQGLHALRQWIFDHGAGPRVVSWLVVLNVLAVMVFIAGNLSTFLLTLGWCDLGFGEVSMLLLHR